MELFCFVGGKVITERYTAQVEADRIEQGHRMVRHEQACREEHVVSLAEKLRLARMQPTRAAFEVKVLGNQQAAYAARNAEQREIFLENYYADKAEAARKLLQHQQERDRQDAEIALKAANKIESDRLAVIRDEVLRQKREEEADMERVRDAEDARLAKERQAQQQQQQQQQQDRFPPRSDERDRDAGDAMWRLNRAAPVTARPGFQDGGRDGPRSSFQDGGRDGPRSSFQDGGRDGPRSSFQEAPRDKPEPSNWRGSGGPPPAQRDSAPRGSEGGGGENAGSGVEARWKANTGGSTARAPPSPAQPSGSATGTTPDKPVAAGGEVPRWRYVRPYPLIHAFVIW